MGKPVPNTLLPTMSWRVVFRQKSARFLFLNKYCPESYVTPTKLTLFTSMTSWFVRAVTLITNWSQGLKFSTPSTEPLLLIPIVQEYESPAIRKVRFDAERYLPWLFTWQEPLIYQFGLNLPPRSMISIRSPAQKLKQASPQLTLLRSVSNQFLEMAQQSVLSKSLKEQKFWTPPYLEGSRRLEGTFYPYQKSLKSEMFIAQQRESPLLSRQIRFKFRVKFISWGFFTSGRKVQTRLWSQWKIQL